MARSRADPLATTATDAPRARRGLAGHNSLVPPRRTKTISSRSAAVHRAALAWTASRARGTSGSTAPSFAQRRASVTASAPSKTCRVEVESAGFGSRKGTGTRAGSGFGPAPRTTAVARAGPSSGRDRASRSVATSSPRMYSNVSWRASRPARHDRTHASGEAVDWSSARRVRCSSYVWRQSGSSRSAAARAAPSGVPRASAAAAHTDLAGAVVDRVPFGAAGKLTPGPSNHQSVAEGRGRGGGEGIEAVSADMLEVLEGADSCQQQKRTQARLSSRHLWRAARLMEKNRCQV